MKVAIVGINGIPPKFGGFDTFALEIAKRINHTDGISIIVYCEASGSTRILRDEYMGIKRVLVPREGKFGVIHHRVLSVKDAIRVEKVNIVFLLSYVAAPFIDSRQFTKYNVKLIVNPDGLEWKRTKYPLIIRKYLKLCERIAVNKADLIIVDSVKIGEYIKNTYKKTYEFVPNGTNLRVLSDSKQESDFLKSLGLLPRGYYIVVGRCVSENNILMIIKGFNKSFTKKKLLVITNLDNSKYSKVVIKACSRDKRDILYGSLYDEEKMRQVRSNAFGYIHGHSVGGTNPSLVESMGYENIILAHDNIFNREVVSDELGYFFSNSDDLAKTINLLENQENLDERRKLLIERVRKEYNWDIIAEKYMNLFKRCRGGSL